MKKNSSIIGVAGSPRSCIKSQDIYNIIDNCKDFDQLYETIYKLGGDKKISNSEGLLLAALYGAKEIGVDINHVLLNDFFSKNQTLESQLAALAEITETANGLIVSSPVYFGDRSSLVADWLLLLKSRYKNLPLDKISIGTVSVGAKRNGGQETTNAYALFDCLNLGACVVGNGPPTSQYGGTGLGGAMGAIIDDTFGLSTSRGTGQRVALLTKIQALDHSKLVETARILFVITRSDRNNAFLEKIKDLPFSENIIVDVLDIANKSLARCLACPVCPSGAMNEEYTCRIQPTIEQDKKDEMKSIHERLIKADGIVIAHYNGSDAGNDNFQVFLERTRFVRRNNFELGNRCFSLFTETDQTPDIFILRGLTSFLRHNMLLLGPFYSAFKKGKDLVCENIGFDTYARRLEVFVKQSKLARLKGINTKNVLYEPIGYPPA